ncbi:MAG: B12-binding domain-containing radical SAM protein [Lachnospiraceae bacterium]|nr:B12-binding domain-containing radical SAM protein [Lachnospiraceae bacterium]
MKFLLIAINAKYIHTNPAVYSIKSYIESFIITSAKNAVISDGVEIAEYTINNSPSDILADIYALKPDVVAFSCYIWNRLIVERLAAELPKIMPGVPIWLGGPEVSYDSEEIMKHYPAVTGIVIGEGEQTCKEIYEYYCANFPGEPAKIELEQIKGIICRNQNGEIIITPGRELININELSFSYADLAGHDLVNRIIYYESSRGCPFRCSYCLSSIDKTIRYKDMDKIKAELSTILAHEVSQIKFVDRTFNCKREHALEIWQFIRNNDNGITNFHFEIAADLLTDMQIELLKTFRPGLIQLEIGVQSTHQKTLESINRKMDFTQVKRMVKALKANQNIHLHLDLIAGLPEENYEIFADSFNDVYSLKPEKLQLGFLKVLPGTPIRQDAELLNIVYEDTPPYQVLCTKWLTYPEMRWLHRIEEMVNIFYNTNQFSNTIAVLGLAFENPFKMYEKLADFFTEKDYFRKAPARVFRYQALLDFAVKYDAKNENCYRELLTHDMYLREKTKTRPGFAHDLSPYRKEIAAFYANEKPGNNTGMEHRTGKEIIRMSTVEVFYYDVDANEAEDKLKHNNEPRFLFYDYQKRDALTNNASVKSLSKMPYNGMPSKINSSY